ncbi:MAG: sugar transferase [Balneolaceae bacterium]
MDRRADSNLTVKERLAIEAKKQVNGTHVNGTNGVHKNGKSGSDSIHLAYKNLKVKDYPGKRILDLSLGFFAMVIFLLLTPFIALGIKLSSRGPVFFKQRRTGKNGKTFTCYKFRTMQVGAKKSNPMPGLPDITTRGDSRVFAFGSFLRFLNLDELPQIINVFKGDMSLVGPRPYPVDECSYWNSMFDDFYYRYAVKPGITGYAQVKGYRGGTLETDMIRKRTDYDLLYVKKNSLLFDIKTIGLTVTQMANLKTNGH